MNGRKNGHLRIFTEIVYENIHQWETTKYQTYGTLEELFRLVNAFFIVIFCVSIVTVTRVSGADIVTMRLTGIDSNMVYRTAALYRWACVCGKNGLYIWGHQGRGPQQLKVHNICTIRPNDTINITLLRMATGDQFLLLPSVASFCHRPVIRLGSCSSIEKIPCIGRWHYSALRPSGNRRPSLLPTAAACWDLLSATLASIGTTYY